jgi:hypothetical protein
MKVTLRLPGWTHPNSLSRWLEALRARQPRRPGGADHRTLSENLPPPRDPPNPPGSPGQELPKPMRFPLRIPEEGHRGSTVGERIKEPVLSPLLSLPRSNYGWGATAERAVGSSPSGT